MTFSTIAELRFTADASQVRKAAQEYDKLVDKTKSFGDETRNATEAQKRAATEAEKFSKKVKELAENQGKTRSEILASKAATLGLSDALSGHIAKIADAEKKNVSFKDTLRDLSENLKGLGSNLSGVATGSTGATEGIASASGALRGLGPVAGSTTGILAALTVTMGVAVIGGLALAGAATAITLQVAAAAAAIDDLSNETGISAERISLLTKLAAEGGSSFDAWNQAATDLATKLAKQDEESGKVAKAIKELGVSTKDANGQQKTHIELMREVVKAAANHEDAAKGQALGLAALGSNYNKLKTSVVEADEKQSAMYDTMKKTGQLMSTSLAKQSGDFMDKIDGLKGAFTGMANSIGTAVLPYLDKLLGKMVSVAETAAGIIRRFTGNSTASELSGDAMAKARADVNASSTAISKLENSEYGSTAGGAAALQAERTRLASAQERLREASRLYEAATRSEADAKRVALAGNAATENKVGNSGIGGKDGKDGKDKDPTQTGEYKEAMRIAQERAAFRRSEEKAIQEFFFKQREEENKAAEDARKNAAERAVISEQFTKQASERIQAIDREIAQRGMSRQQITLENDLRQIQIDLEKELLELKKKGATQAELDAATARASTRTDARQQAESRITAANDDWYAGLTDGLKDYAGTFKSTYENMREIGTGVASSIGNAFSNMAKNGTFSFRAFASSVLADLANIGIKMASSWISKFIMNGIGSFFGAKSTPITPSARGNVFSGGNVIPFATGGVLTTPTTFPMANGNTGLAGEAGAEALIPLARMSNGELGVQAVGGGAAPALHFDMSVNISGNADKDTVNQLREVQSQQRDQILQIVRSEIGNLQRVRGPLYR